MSDPANPPRLTFDPSSLPIAQLESLKFKANQMVESIQLLQRTIEYGGQNAMPAWPDVLSKYNILLSQSHNLATSLLGPTFASATGSSSSKGNPYERLSLHPSVPLTDSQLDNELIPLLRNQQTTNVLKIENDIVRHLSEHMETKGTLGVLTQTGRPNGPAQGKRTEYEDVLSECEQIRVEHDERVDRAVRAVAMLREKYDWKARVAVDQEEPEDLEWDIAPFSQSLGGDDGTMRTPGGAGDVDSAETPDGAQSNDSEEEEELEEVLGNGGDHTPGGTPGGSGAAPSSDLAATPMIEG
ncbi:hypothetical protein POSPLADRAFT_1040012 [Postia placenta MAD-698-R-SB12]|uniref:Mediator of RNA polymerase II transcription subunit 8 n=1 Tax=Postia placenta MAD-698-R-SB12 TaxID=670580 RepID=A0A1X6N115_9APHY|nr:hypothetical protein POSPLADRAFT_1040012 [Postia placenta MAD-698-R-SB12]OSX62321.1 hypothetical protein POSPLADRAFT_1040012 [Postia placenta MAD-698-R-SB12]